MSADLTFAASQARRAGEASTDCAEAIDDGRIDEALDLLSEARERLTRVQDKLREVARAR